MATTTSCLDGYHHDCPWPGDCDCTCHKPENRESLKLSERLELMRVQWVNLYPTQMDVMARCAEQARALERPIPMVLFCPSCGEQHIDEPESLADYTARKQDLADTTGPWTNPPHRSHQCQRCKHVWRPADVPTIGVRSITTQGKHDSERADPRAAFHVWEELSARVGCTSPDGHAELEQVSYRAARIRELEDSVEYLAGWCNHYAERAQETTREVYSQMAVAIKSAQDAHDKLRDATHRGIIIGVEFGVVCAEKGMNATAALIKAKETIAAGGEVGRTYEDTFGRTLPCRRQGVASKSLWDRRERRRS